MNAAHTTAIPARCPGESTPLDTAATEDRKSPSNPATGHAGLDEALLALLKDDKPAAATAPAWPKRLHPARLARGVLLRWKLSAVLMLSVLVLTTIAALTAISPKWQSATTLIVVSQDALLSVGGGDPYELRTYNMETLLDTLKLPSSLDTTLQRAQVDGTRLQLAAAIDVRMAQKSDVLSLKVTWDSPQAAQRLTNELSRTFVDRLALIRREQASTDFVRYQSQLEDARQRLAAVDADVLRFQQEHGVASFEEETKARLIELSRLQADHWEQQAQVQALQTARTDFESTLASVPETTTATLFRNPVAKHLEEIDWQLKEARSRYTEENPKVITLVQQREVLQSLLPPDGLSGGETTRSPNDLRRDLLVKQQDLLTTQRIAEGRAAGLAESVARMADKISKLAALEKQFRQLEARQNAARELESSLSAKTEEARVAMSTDLPSLQIVEAAQVPIQPLPSGRKLLLIAGCFVGLLLATAWPLLLEVFDPRVRCREDVEDLTDEHSFCVELGRIQRPEKEWRNATSPALQPLRRFVNSVRAQNADWSSVAFVSVESGAGRSTLAHALATVLTARAEHVLLMDADLRPTAGPRPFRSTNDYGGLLESLRDATPVDYCLERLEQERLVGVGAGTGEPDDAAVLLLERPELGKAIDRFAARGRRVLVDLPPCGCEDSAFELACRVGSAFLVARYHNTHRAELNELAERLRARKVRILGVLVTDVPPQRLHSVNENRNAVSWYDTFRSWVQKASGRSISHA